MSNSTFLKGDLRLDFIEGSSSFRLFLVSLVLAVFIIYPNIAFFPIEHDHLGEAKSTAHILFFIFRYLFFSALIWSLIRFNLLKFKTPTFRRRLVQTFLISGIAYVIYSFVSILLSPKPEWISGLLLFQFLMMFILCALIGHMLHLYAEQRRREQEIEELRIENMQSRYDALTNQINPHFFFNSLNGLIYLIRKKSEEKSLEYVNKMSDVFRYILQSDKKGLVSLGEELEFARAFFYMMEIRYANKLIFNISVPDNNTDLRLPVLSLLPLIDNVVVHNTIDSEHKMEVNISLNQQMELSVSNPVFPKLDPPSTNGTGLKNLENRFLLLMNKQIRIKKEDTKFTVYLPMKIERDENTDS